MKKLLAAGLLTVVATTSAGCLGPNKAFNGIHEWNQELSDQDWLNEVVFLGFTILPVYSLAYLLDIVVLNTVDYWSDGGLD